MHFYCQQICLKMFGKKRKKKIHCEISLMFPEVVLTSAVVMKCCFSYMYISKNICLISCCSLLSKHLSHNWRSRSPSGFALLASAVKLPAVKNCGFVGISKGEHRSVSLLFVFDLHDAESLPEPRQRHPSHSAPSHHPRRCSTGRRRCLFSSR